MGSSLGLAFASFICEANVFRMLETRYPVNQETDPLVTKAMSRACQIQHRQEVKTSIRKQNLKQIVAPKMAPNLARAAAKN